MMDLGSPSADLELRRRVEIGLDWEIMADWEVHLDLMLALMRDVGGRMCHW